MAKATDELLKDHKMIRKIMEGWSPDNPRFEQIHKTLRRVVVGHAWFEDVIFFPVLEAEPLLVRRFLDELYQEHKDIHYLLNEMAGTPVAEARKLEFLGRPLRVLLDTHFSKEEDALFPLCEKVLNEENLNQLTEEMRRRQDEMRNLAVD